jgi:hypothetical protein
MAAEPPNELPEGWEAASLSTRARPPAVQRLCGPLEAQGVKAVSGSSKKKRPFRGVGPVVLAPESFYKEFRPTGQDVKVFRPIPVCRRNADAA